LTATGVKPSFLIWEKVYQKLTTTDEETWLLRASEKALTTCKAYSKSSQDGVFVIRTRKSRAAAVRTIGLADLALLRMGTKSLRNISPSIGCAYAEKNSAITRIGYDYRLNDQQ
jgi:hypothetical protein